MAGFEVTLHGRFWTDHWGFRVCDWQFPHKVLNGVFSRVDARRRFVFGWIPSLRFCKCRPNPWRCGSTYLLTKSCKEPPNFTPRALAKALSHTSDTQAWVFPMWYCRKWTLRLWVPSRNHNS